MNHIEQPSAALQERLDILTENMNTIKYSGERYEQVSREIAHIAFELSCRYAEETEQTWSEHETGVIE